MHDIWRLFMGCLPNWFPAGKNFSCAVRCIAPDSCARPEESGNRPAAGFHVVATDEESVDTVGAIGEKIAVIVGSKPKRQQQSQSLAIFNPSVRGGCRCVTRFALQGWEPF